MYVMEFVEMDYELGQKRVMIKIDLTYQDVHKIADRKWMDTHVED